MTCKCLVILASLLASLNKAAFCQTPRVNVPDKLHCVSVTSVITRYGNNGFFVQQEKSADEFVLSRRNNKLLVQVVPKFYSELESKTRTLLLEPEVYTIIGETGEGLTATEVKANQTSEDTLILKRDLSRAVWIETAFSFLSPQSEPLSHTVSLNCGEIKQ